MVFKFLNSFFPVKSGSLDDFISLVCSENASSVTAEPRITTKTDPFSITITKKYSSVFESETKTGRPIVFHEFYTSREEFAFYMGGGPDLTALRVLRTIYDRLEIIEGRLPGTETRVVGRKGEIDNEERLRIYSHAQERGLTPFER